MGRAMDGDDDLWAGASYHKAIITSRSRAYVAGARVIV